MLIETHYMTKNIKLIFSNEKHKDIRIELVETTTA